MYTHGSFTQISWSGSLGRFHDTCNETNLHLKNLPWRGCSTGVTLEDQCLRMGYCTIKRKILIKSVHKWRKIQQVTVSPWRRQWFLVSWFIRTRVSYVLACVCIYLQRRYHCVTTDSNLSSSVTYETVMYTRFERTVCFYVYCYIGQYILTMYINNIQWFSTVGNITFSWSLAGPTWNYTHQGFCVELVTMVQKPLIKGKARRGSLPVRDGFHWATANEIFTRHQVAYLNWSLASLLVCHCK